MIKEERVREEYKLALAEERYGKDFDKIESYFGFDYIGKEMLISFITGTLCYFVLLAIWVLMHFEELLDRINSLDYLGMGVTAAMYYAAFLLVYLFVTALVYLYRYLRMKKKALRFDAHLKRLNKMYVREEKLKL